MVFTSTNGEEKENNKEGTEFLFGPQYISLHEVPFLIICNHVPPGSSDNFPSFRPLGVVFVPSCLCLLWERQDIPWIFTSHMLQKALRTIAFGRVSGWERQMRRVPRNRVLSETGFATPEKTPGKPTTPGQRQTRTVENPTTDLS